MAKVVDSAQWTGISTDPFAALSTEERQGLLVFAPKKSRLIRSLLIVAIVIALGVSLSVFAWLGVVLPHRKEMAFISQQTGTMIAGSFLTAAAALVGYWFWERLTNINQTAPLTISLHGFVAGESGCNVKFRDITAIESREAMSAFGMLAKIFYSSPFWMFRNPRHTPFLEIKTESKPSLILDLDVLDGAADRIEMILRYRLQNLNGNTNV